jgi:hypothetical protein
MGLSSATTRVAWGASDASGVDFFRVRYRQVGGAWTTIVSATDNPFVDRTLAIGRAYEFEILARDFGGNVTTRTIPVKLYRYQESVPQAAYTGTWRSATVAGASGGRTRWASSAGASVTFSFYGKGVGLVAPLGPSRGQARLYVDGTYVATVNLQAATNVARRIVFSKAWTANGPHTLKLVVRGTAGHARVDVDALLFDR